MNISGLLTSAGVNTGICVGVFSLYSVLRKQPNLVSVYFGQKLSQLNFRSEDPFWFGRLVPSASWIVKAWEASEDELYAAGGLDAVVFLRAVIFSIRVFSVASFVCLCFVLPVNYYGKQMNHKGLYERLDVFTIGNVDERSKWLPVHCLALYMISCCACLLLYFEYKNIMKMRLAHIAGSLSHPSYFTVIVRAIPRTQERTYSDVVSKYFTDFYGSSYLSHQMVYHSGAMRKLLHKVERMYKTLKSNHLERRCIQLIKCSFCGAPTTRFNIVPGDCDSENSREEACLDGSDVRKKECRAALVFFRTRSAALVAADAQSPNPMLWVSDPAPEPDDIYWSNLCVPYRLLWIRRVAVVAASVFFVIFFLVPVVFTQGLVHLDKLQKVFPLLKVILRRKVFAQLISGYLPSVVFIIFLSIAPPLMLMFSTLEGAISRSNRKRSTCIKFVYFVIWNVFFANILTEAAIEHYQISITKLQDPKSIPNVLARAVQATATFFMTYVLTSGWTSLSFELIQPFPLICNSFYRYILRNKDDLSYGTYTFPYHTEVPRVLLFGLLGFSCSIMAPLILPILMVYFALAFVVYRNQILNVYKTEYDTGGLYWPIVHNTTIFSLVLTQTIALGLFGIKKSPVASAFTFPLIICTLLFHEFCRQRFHPIFKKIPTQTLMEMDKKDTNSDVMHEKLQFTYCQFKSKSLNLHENAHGNGVDVGSHEDLEGEGNLSEIT